MAHLIIFPGDWHFLKNYQEVLLKIYFDAGLSNGYCGPGCKCTGCTNLPVEALAAEQEDIDSASR